MMLRAGLASILNGRVSTIQLVRCLGFSTTSSNDEMVSLTLQEGGIATATMQHAPVNSLSLEMCQSLSQAIQTAEEDASVQALILQSSHPTIFSAGLDLQEMHQPDSVRLQDFWSSFQQLYLDLYGSRLACIAAIQGHAPAAGCMLALSCDYRLMTDNSKAKIGLNETKLGIVAPPWLGKQMMDTVGKRQAERALSLGLLFSPTQALEMGLVDEVVQTDAMEERALNVAMEYAQIPPQARVGSKMLVRKERLLELKASRKQDLEDFCSFVTRDQVQRNLTAYLEGLASKKK